MNKPRVADKKIKKILRLLGSGNTYDTIMGEASTNRPMISNVKKWYNSLPWLEAKVYAEDDENILKTRTDYLKKKAFELEAAGKQKRETLRNSTTRQNEGGAAVNHISYSLSDVIESVRKIVVDPRTDSYVEQNIFNPARGDRWELFKKDSPFGFAFNVEIKDSNILIESIRIRNSDPEVPFRLVLSESDLQDSDDWEKQDMIHMRKPVTKAVYTYPQVSTIVRYHNGSAQKKLFGAFYIYFNERPLRFDIYGDGNEAVRDYFRKPITFEVTLRYLIGVHGSV